MPKNTMIKFVIPVTIVATIAVVVFLTTTNRTPDCSKYKTFSAEKFPDTGGYDPVWLQCEKSNIQRVCEEVMDVGRTLYVCRYVMEQ